MICLVIPCYNEEKRLSLTPFLECLNKNTWVSFLFVNDGSRDGTENLIREFAQKSDRIDYLSLKENVGKAEAVRQGMNSLLDKDVDYIGYWDADLATPLSELDQFYALTKNHPYHVVMGSRILRLGGDIDRKWSRHLLGRVFATCSSTLLGLPVYDTQCGAKLFAKEISQKVFSDSFLSRWLFDVEILFRYKALGMANKTALIEVPLEQWKDEHGSKLKLSDFLKAPMELLRMYLKYGS